MIFATDGEQHGGHQSSPVVTKGFSREAGLVHQGHYSADGLSYIGSCLEPHQSKGEIFGGFCGIFFSRKPGCSYNFETTLIMCST